MARHHMWNIIDIDMDTVASTFPLNHPWVLDTCACSAETWLIKDPWRLQDSLLKEFVSHNSLERTQGPPPVSDHRHSVNLSWYSEATVQTLGFWESIHWWVCLGFEIRWPGSVGAGQQPLPYIWSHWIESLIKNYKCAQWLTLQVHSSFQDLISFPDEGGKRTRWEQTCRASAFLVWTVVAQG